LLHQLLQQTEKEGFTHATARYLVEVMAYFPCKVLEGNFAKSF